MAKNITKANIGNALHSVAEDHVTAVAEDVFDERTQKYQSEINEEQEGENTALQNSISSMETKVESLEESYNALDKQKHVFLTESEYDALETKDADTLYFTTEE